jgi:hypothetical protein
VCGCVSCCGNIGCRWSSSPGGCSGAPSPAPEDTSPVFLCDVPSSLFSNQLLFCTTSQLDRSDFQSTTGSHEGAFRAEPAAGDHRTTHGGAGEVRGAGGWVPDPPCHAKPDYALENGSPAARGAGGCQVVVAGGAHPPGPRGAGLGLNRSTGRLGTSRARCGGICGGQPADTFSKKKYPR